MNEDNDDDFTTLQACLSDSGKDVFWRFAGYTLLALGVGIGLALSSWAGVNW